MHRHINYPFILSHIAFIIRIIPTNATSRNNQFACSKKIMENETTINPITTLGILNFPARMRKHNMQSKINIVQLPDKVFTNKHSKSNGLRNPVQTISQNPSTIEQQTK